MDEWMMASLMDVVLAAFLVQVMVSTVVMDLLFVFFFPF